MKNEPLVSIVITTKNEEKNIAHCLKSIKEQTYRNIEIIVVDNHSNDKTKQIAKKYTDKVYNKGPERSAQRNYGMIEKSTGKYVMYVDADMIFSPDLIHCAVEEMQKNRYAALYIKEIVLGKNFWSRVRRFERSFYDGTAIDGARFFERGIFIKTGGFDQSISGPEDWDMDKKINHKYTNRTNITNRSDKNSRIGLLNDNRKYNKWGLEKFIREKGVDPKKYSAVIYHNESEFDLKKYLEKKGYYSRSFATYIKKWGSNDPDVKKQLGFYYRYFGVFMENGKWKKLICHPILTFGMYYLRFLVGLKYIFRK